MSNINESMTFHEINRATGAADDLTNLSQIKTIASPSHLKSHSKTERYIPQSAFDNDCNPLKFENPEEADDCEEMRDEVKNSINNQQPK